MSDCVPGNGWAVKEPRLCPFCGGIRGECAHPLPGPGDTPLNRERRQTASVLRDLARRIGVAASPEWVRGQLEQIANRLEAWASEMK